MCLAARGLDRVQPARRFLSGPLLALGPFQGRICSQRRLFCVLGDVQFVRTLLRGHGFWHCEQQSIKAWPHGLTTPDAFCKTHYESVLPEHLSKFSCQSNVANGARKRGRTRSHWTRRGGQHPHWTHPGCSRTRSGPRRVAPREGPSRHWPGVERGSAHR